MRQNRGTGRAAAAALTATMLLAGCSGGDASDETPPPSATPTTTAEPTEQVSLAPGVTIPDTRAGRAAEWVLDQPAAAHGPSGEEAAARLALTVLSEVPATCASAV